MFTRIPPKEDFTFRNLEKVICSEVRHPTPDNIFQTPTPTGSSQVDMSNPFQGLDASANSIVSTDAHPSDSVVSVPSVGSKSAPDHSSVLEGFQETFIGLTADSSGKKAEIEVAASDLDSSLKAREM